MATNLERYKTALDKLVALGSKMLLDLQGRHLLEKGNVKPDKKKLLEELNGTFERVKRCQIYN